MMRRSSVSLFATCILLSAWITAALGMDHKNLDEGRPLRLQDAYVVSSGELALEGGAGFALKRKGEDKAVFDLNGVYGLFPNFQMELGTTLFTTPHESEEPDRSGNLKLGGLYNFNQETLTVPAFGLKAALGLPTGVDSEGVNGELIAIVTKSFGRLSLHFNGGYELVSEGPRGGRDGRYKLAFGPSYPLGAPMYTRLTLMADFFAEQSLLDDEDDTLGAEVGFRYQMTERMVIDAGIGSELAGPEDRSDCFGAVGISYSF